MWSKSAENCPVLFPDDNNGRTLVNNCSRQFGKTFSVSPENEWNLIEIIRYKYRPEHIMYKQKLTIYEWNYDRTSFDRLKGSD